MNAKFNNGVNQDEKASLNKVPAVKQVEKYNLKNRSAENEN
ncbi:hypothetical protein [Oceanobacillus profundus]|nr:hypothetical protein [Oceanobacillus profundus]